MNLDKTVTMTLGDQEYKLKYDINALIKLETLISTKNISKMIGDFPLSHGDTIICLAAGLEAEHPSMNLNKAKNLFGKLLKEYNITEIQTIILQALIESGAVGKAGEIEEVEATEEQGE